MTPETTIIVASSRPISLDSPVWFKCVRLRELRDWGRLLMRCRSIERKFGLRQIP
jgi:hypothetical protein